MNRAEKVRGMHNTSEGLHNILHEQTIVSIVVKFEVPDGVMVVVREPGLNSTGNRKNSVKKSAGMIIAVRIATFIDYVSGGREEIQEVISLF